MSLFKVSGQSKSDAKAAVAKYEAAKRALRANQEREERAGTTGETAEYRRLNKAVLDAEKDVPWIKR